MSKITNPQISFFSNFVLLFCNPELALLFLSNQPTNTNGNGHSEYAHTGNQHPSPVPTYCTISIARNIPHLVKNRLQLEWHS